MKKMFLAFTLFLFASFILAHNAVEPIPLNGEGSENPGSVSNPFQIASWENLYWISQNSAHWDKHYIQTGDIDFTDAVPAINTWDSNQGWSPIGNSTTRFTGNYDGNGKTINGLYIYRVSSNSQGLFGSIGSGAELSGLGLIGANITGQECIVGGLIGRNSGAVSNCYVKGSVSGTADNIGGLIGWNDNGSVSNCYASVSVTGTGMGEYIYDIGGLMGWNLGSVTNCYSSGSVTATGMGDDIYDIGGLIGFNEGSISNCYASVEVTGTAYDIGGLIGFNEGSISNCYASGEVTGSGGDIGGFLGYYHFGTITACFWDNSVNSALNGAGGVNSGYSDDEIIGKSTTEMRMLATFTDAGWDFKGIGEEGIWNIGNERNDDYPYLDWQYPEDVPLPITLASFTGVVLNGQVQLSWQTATETENLAFRIYRNNEMIAELEGAGTTSEPHSYIFTDNHVIPGRTYTYVLADVTIGNQEVRHSDKAVTITVGDGNIAKDYSIGASYPNPFNPMCIVPLNLATSANVNAALHDINGRLVKELYKCALSAGSHDLKIDGANLATGIYLVKIQINDALHVQKIALMK